MRRLIGFAAGLLLVTGAAYSQFVGGQIGAHYGAGRARSFSAAPPIARSTFAHRLGATVSGYQGNLWRGGQIGVNYGTGPYRGTRRQYRPRHYSYVYGVPFYYGGWGYGYAPQPTQVTVQNIPPPQPPVIINQYYKTPEAKPVVRNYSQGQLPEPAGMRAYHAPVPSHPEPAGEGDVANADRSDDEPTIYLIVFKDQSIYPAVGYWIEDDTLHYITTQGSHNRASLDLVDREFSERLNRERNVKFELQTP